jgi:hypothetical protein
MERNILLLLAWVSTLLSQGQHFYAEASGTVQFPAGGISFVTADAYGTFEDQYANIHSQTLNLGKGAGAAFAFGRTLSDHLSLELRGTYIKGRSSEFLSSYNGTERYNDTYESRYFRIEPAIRLRTASAGVSLYAAAGPSFLMAAEIIHRDEYDRTSEPHGFHRNQTYTSTYKDRVGLGAFSAIGISWHMNEQLALFTELNFTVQYWKPARVEVDLLSSTTDMGQTSTSNGSYTAELLDEYSEISYDKTKRPAQLFPFSSWGIRTGISFIFGRRMG